MASRFVTVGSVLLLCLLLVGASVAEATPATLATAAVTSSQSDDTTDRAQVLVQQANETNETNGTGGDTLTEPVPVVDHEDPRTALGRANVRAIGSYLVGSMSNRLAQSVRLLDQGEYPEGRAVLGPEYDRLYDRYDDVRGDLGTSPTDAARFVVVRDEQIRYIDAVQEYHLIREDYLEARRDADSFRSRRLAREMEQQAEIVVASRDNLVANYTLMTQMNGDQRNETIRLIDQQAERVTALQSTVREQEFVDTRLRVRIPNTTGSFAAPYRLFATVTTVNGTPLSNESGQFTVGGRSYPVETDANGTFAVDYRPTTIPEGSTTVEARFFVDEQSQYLGDRTTVTLFVNQETPAITVAARPTTVGFGEELVVSGDVGGVVPNATSFDERRLAINAYRDRLRAAAEAEARAEARAAANETAANETAVNETAANETAVPIDVEINETAIQTAPLPPELREPLPTEFVGAGNVTLVVAIGDLRLGTVETAPDGRYRFVMTVTPEIRRGAQPIRVALVEPDRALAPTTATTNVTVRTTPTRTRLDEVTTRGRELLLSGSLTTATPAATPLAGQQIEIRLDGSVVETVRTAEDGSFTASVSLPTREESRSTARVVAAFDTPTNNLEASQSAESVVALPESRTAVSEEVPVIARLREALGIADVVVVLPVVEFGVSPEIVAGVVGLVVLAVSLLVVARRRRPGPLTAAGRRRLGDVTNETLGQVGRPDPTDVTDTTPPAAYLRAAHEALRRNPRLATEYAYVAVRRHLATDSSLPTRVTHREFLEAVRDREHEVGDAIGLLTLTKAYERAAFSPRGVSTDDAEQAVFVAEQFLG